MYLAGAHAILFVLSSHCCCCSFVPFNNNLEQCENRAYIVNTPPDLGLNCQSSK